MIWHGPAGCEAGLGYAPLRAVVDSRWMHLQALIGVCLRGTARGGTRIYLACLDARCSSILHLRGINCLKIRPSTCSELQSKAGLVDCTPEQLWLISSPGKSRDSGHSAPVLVVNLKYSGPISMWYSTVLLLTL